MAMHGLIPHNTYRYAFQGQERDDEVKGAGNSYTTEFRQYDSRLGRWLTIDPILKAHESPYAGYANNPILNIDLDGRDTTVAHQEIINHIDRQGWNIETPSLVKWKTADIAAWKITGDKFIFAKKENFITYYKNVLADAAEMYDIPLFLLAGVAFSEYGGDPLWIDDVAYSLRDFDQSGSDKMDEMAMFKKDPLMTSFGNVSIQVKVAAQTLGYDQRNMTGPNDLNPELNLTNDEEAHLIKSLKNPVMNIYIAAAHLSQLKNVDYRNVKSLNKEQVMVIATRYNRGPDVPLDDIKKNLSYGKSIYKHECKIYEALTRDVTIDLPKPW